MTDALGPGGSEAFNKDTNTHRYKDGNKGVDDIGIRNADPLGILICENHSSQCEEPKWYQTWKKQKDILTTDHSPTTASSMLQ